MPRAKKPKSNEDTAKTFEAAEIDILAPEEYQVIRATDIWSYTDTGHDLTVEESLFCRSYIIDRNPVAALKRLGHMGTNATLRSKAERYLSLSEVRGCVEVLAQQMMDRLQITAEKVQERLAAVAFFDPREVLSFDAGGVTMLHSRFWTREQAMALQSVEMGKEGIKLKMYDALRATEMLGKQLGTIKDDSVEASAAASKAAAEAVMNTIKDIFDKVVPDDEPIPALANFLPDDGEPIVH